MTVLRFDGTDDHVIFPIGSFNGMAGGPITYGCLYRTDDIAVTRTMVEIGVNAGGRIGLGVSSGDFYRFYNGGSTRDGPTTPSGWFLGVTTKASGSVAPRYHVYDFSAGTWSHGAQGAATANQTLGNGEVRFGESLAGAQDWTGDIGLGFLANVELSDAQVEAMTTNRKTSDIWTAISGATTKDLYELTSGSSITSLGGSAETSRTGTTTTAESIPGGWSFDGAGSGTTATPTPGGATVGGVAPSPRVAASSGGIPASGSAPSPVAAAGTGGLLAQGSAPSPQTAVSAGGIPTAGTAPGIVVSVSAGGATAGGFAPSDGTAVTETPTPGGAVIGGSGPTAAITTTAGGLAAAGASPSIYTTATAGGVAAAGAEPDPAVSTAAGGALATGAAPIVYVLVSPGGVSVGGQVNDPLAVAITAHFGPPSPSGGSGQGSPGGAHFGPPSPGQVRV